MQIAPYLFFNGNARDAATFYADVFGVDVPEFMTMDGAPPEMNVPENRKGWIMHCTMQIGDYQLMMSDDFMANSPPMAGCNVQLNFETAAEGKRVFDALSAGGEVRMPWEPTFWSAGFGAFSDKFGVRWMIGTDEPPAN
ncbi:PhnB protein [Cognatiyoonia koreensis]|uniref:PhnB protein n=1 Tax=Cognatiyoonia koreensis TaxID=364200 RepID=A0A1I0MH45_9RHOB|nr:VOC family protein [Cognatiyoonia koreensis]SEV87622.1 PhnB protein [Cognatiyoonia koreensis]